MKKKVKLILSDLHLGKGNFNEDGSNNILEEFYYDSQFSEFVNYYSTNEFEASEVEIILNGDILNLLQVDYKGHFSKVLTEDMAFEKLKSVLEAHPLFFEALKKFTEKNNKIVYVIGNHDQEMLWPKAQEYFSEVCGGVEFRSLVYFFDGVHVEHGHMHEGANRVNPKKFFLRKNLPQPVLNIPFGSHFFLDFVIPQKFVYPHLDKVRPFGKNIVFLLFTKPGFIISSLFKLIKFLIQAAFVKSHARSWNIKTIFSILIEGAVFPDLSDGAFEILKDQRVHTVVFGHSHVYKYRQWKNGKQYFNSGTWTDLTSLDLESLGKITKLTYVLFEYRDHERPKGRLKEWKGYHRVEEDIAIT